MNNEEKKIVPQLRFPEFEKDGSWDKKKLEKLSHKISDGIHSTPKYDENGEYFFVNGNNLIDGKIAITESTKRVSKEEFQKHKRELGKNSILLSINGTIGNISEYNNEKIVLGKSACYININEDKTDKLFIIYSLKTEGIRRFFDTELTGSTIKNLSLKTVKNTVINLPKPKEQEKIANCLSSLDNVITAETEKLDLLQDHKKGLLQQLFPAEGDALSGVEGRNQPKFRFPEFKDDRDWEEKRLDEIAKVVTGSTPKTSDSENYGGNKLFVSPADISEDRYIIKTGKTLSEKGFSKSRIIPANSILFVCIGSTIGKLAQNKIECTTNQQINSLIPFKDNSNDFIYSLLENNSNYIASLSAQQAVPLINKSEFSSVKLHFPTNPKEQQKIANSLSSADNLIAAQTQKIELLQEHKKGLLQQLFPNVNELAI